MLHVLEFLPSGLALLDGEAHSASNRNPVGTESGVPFEFNQACWFSVGGSGCFRLRVVAGCGAGAVDGVSSESFESGWMVNV